ncbi:hypothetical protein M0534_01565 [Methylonatrum kenyense]|uniref:hypothetical protein n=1 Tax=Methylonatrum kenyense TaxID=455253 RepID=UPI0020BE413E|nr:hypothetical protein [Methylonatrum kenyense]MCK8515019.1 hypothetical protein [Methylonatrum kenyense]
MSFAKLRLILMTLIVGLAFSIGSAGMAVADEHGGEDYEDGGHPTEADEDERERGGADK